MAKLPLNCHALVVTAILCAVSFPTPGYALDEVIDHGAIAKLGEQISQLQKQLDALTKIVAATRQQADAVGKAGQIQIPMPNLSRITSRLRQDAQCLMPNMDRLMPGVQFDDQSLGSICSASLAYRGALWVDPQKLAGKSWTQKEAIFQEATTRRNNLGVDVASKAIGQADTAARGAEDMNKAVADLESAVNAAKDSNEWLAAIAQGQVVQARATVQQTQLLTSILKVQGTWMAITALPPHSVLAADQQGGTGQ